MMKLLYFAWVRDRIGRSEETIHLPPGARTLGDLLAHLEQQSENHAMALQDRTRLRFAVDQEYADEATQLAGTQEVAIFPPVTGG